MKTDRKLLSTICLKNISRLHETAPHVEYWRTEMKRKSVTHSGRVLTHTLYIHIYCTRETEQHTETGSKSTEIFTEQKGREQEFRQEKNGIY